MSENADDSSKKRGSSSNGRLVTAFRERLLDGGVRARLHGERGEPRNGTLQLQADKITLQWRHTPPCRAFPLLWGLTQLLHRTVADRTLALQDVRRVRGGRQSSNLVRTIKYVAADDLPASDDRCLSLCSMLRTDGSDSVTDSVAPTTAELQTLDLEFDDKHERDIALSFFWQETSSSGAELAAGDGESVRDIQLPRGWPTRCFQLVSHPSFDLLLLLLIVVSMFSVAMESLDSGVATEDARLGMTVLEALLLALLTLEQICRVVGLEGLLPLLRHKWNVFDLVVVIISWCATLSLPWLSGWNLLSLRIFRSLRLVKRWSGFQEMIATFLEALPMAGNALLCYCYYLFLFAILGMYLFSDSLSHRCAIPSTDGSQAYLPASPTRFCRVDMDSDVAACKSGMACVSFAPPDHGYTGFHSFQAAFLTVFLVTLRSGFGPALDGVQQASSYFAVVFFIALVVFVSFMIPSLFVGVVRGSYLAVLKLQAPKRTEWVHQWERYRRKQRVQFPKATETFPDVLQLASDTCRDWYHRATELVLRSPLFARNDDALFSCCRLRQERVFFLLHPESLLVNRITFVAESAVLEHFMNVVVFGNSILFALEYHGMEPHYAARLYMAENLLIVLYGAEFFLLCATAGGLMKYLQNPWNRLDFILLTAACLEFVLLAASMLFYTDGYARGIFVLRLFRLVRPFRVVRKNNKLLRVLNAILASVPAFLSSLAFHALLNSVFAVVGMHLFAGRFPSSMTSHYDTFGDSVLTLFKFSCGGGIWPIFHASLQASSFGAVLIYYMSYVMLCGHLALNFVQVVLLRHFSLKGDERRKMLSELFEERMLVMQRIHRFDVYSFVKEFTNLYQKDVVNISLSSIERKRAQSVNDSFATRLLRVLPASDFLKLKGFHHRRVVGPMRGSQQGSYQRLKKTPSLRGEFTGQPSRACVVEGSSASTARTLEDRSTLTNTSVAVLQKLRVTDSTRGVKANVREFLSGHWLMADVSLCIFPPNSRLRLRCRQLERETEKFIFAAIVTRTVMLTLQSPLYSALIQELTTLSDVVFACVLLFEFGIKVISRGFLFTPRSYMSDPWNQVNLMVLLACSLLLLLPHSTMISLFRLGRAFGPIRVFYRVRTFRVITEALQQSAKPVFFCVVLALFLFYSFATLGMQIFGGKFAFCSDPTVDSADDCVGMFVNRVNGILMPRVWGNLSGLHFDNIGGAMSSILFLVSMKGWLPVVNHAMDFTEGTENHHGNQASANASAYFAVFFVVFLFFTRFFLLKVFAGILMNNFRSLNGTLLLTNVQLLWLRKKQMIVALRPKFPLPTSRFMQLAQIYMQKRVFRVCISIAVLLHTSALAWYRSPISHEATPAVEGASSSNATASGVWWCHYAFSFVYATDAVLRVAAVGWKDFLMKGFTWRTFNSFTAFVMLVGPLLSDSPVLLVLGMTRAFDFRHLVLVLERRHAVQTLFRTLLGSVRLALKVTLLLGYALFIFAIVGVQVFSLTRWSAGLYANLNLSTFPSAYTTFVKFAAGEDWYASYLASSVTPPSCVTGGGHLALQSTSDTATLSTRGYTSDCGSPGFSAVFYNAFYVLVVLILQNLYVATVVDTYVLMSAVIDHNKVAQLLGFRDEHLQRFQAVWSDFDTDALGLVHKKHLLALLSRLEPPLGLGTHQEMLGDLLNEDTPPSQWAALSLAVHHRRREIFHDIEARITELSYRSRLEYGSGDTFRVSPGDVGLVAAGYTGCPTSMIRFTDLLLVLTMRILPLESLTVAEKVDELAVRGYAFRHRQAIHIQTAFRMHRVLRRSRRSGRRAVSAARQVDNELAARVLQSASLESKSSSREGCEQPPTHSTLTPTSLERVELQPEASDAKDCYM